MYREQVPVPTGNLRIGMYVSRLDRPWLETPFLFQGFVIEDDQTIDQLQQYCETVFVDAQKSDDSLQQAPFSGAVRPDPAPEKGEPASKPAPGRAASSASTAQQLPSDDNTVRLKVELKKAKQAHATAEEAITDAFDRLRRGDEIDIVAVQEAVTPMVESVCRNEDALSWLARMKKKNDYVYDHSIASSVWAMIFAKHLNLDKADIEIIGLGAMFMDVGKTQVDDELLVKQDSLTDEEIALVHGHVDHGVEICEGLDNLDPRVLEIVRYHHERYNGSGYPEGLKGNEIPTFARIAGIVDAYDAMTTPRPYAETMSTSDALRHLNRLAGVEFQAEMVEQFVQAVGVFPVGTLVELNTGEVAVIVAQNRVRRLRPQIMVLTDPGKEMLSRFSMKDLRNELVTSDGQSIWIERGLPIGAYGIDPSEFFL